jgi:uncharacterized protein (TIGR02328 family)
MELGSSMRLWHEDLIQRLPRQQLLGQHRECCALRGKGWGRRHSTVDYVFQYDRSRLYAYHMLVMDEMRARDYTVDGNWRLVTFCGYSLPLDQSLGIQAYPWPIYPEHDEAYMAECLDNLRGKGIML